MAETAQSLITRALRLINVPGRGALLAAEDLTGGLETLQDLLSSEAVSKTAVPGIVRHYFALTAGQATYTYGPGGELDTDDYDDPAPIRLEDGFIRSGSSLTDNELVSDRDFLVGTPTWTITGNFSVANSRATAAGVGKISQSLALVSGRTYTVKVLVTIETGDVVLRILQDASPLLEQTLDASGEYEFECTFTGTTSAIELETATASDDLYADWASVIQSNVDRFTLPDGQGTDYPLKAIDQTGYNSMIVKGASGRPYRMLYSRGYPTGDLHFDNAPTAGDILVLDVLVDRIRPSNLSSVVRLHDDALLWVRYKLADLLSGEYGKELRRSQVRIMNEAADRMGAGTRRLNLLRSDPALRQTGGGRFSINRGDR